MSTPLDDYKALIDGLVQIRPSVEAGRVLRHQDWPDVPANRTINAYLADLSDAQRETIAEMLQQSRDGGIHDVLVFLNNKMSLDGLRLVRGGVELPVEPFGTEIHYDWVARLGGDPWPEPD